MTNGGKESRVGTVDDKKDKGLKEKSPHKPALQGEQAWLENGEQEVGRCHPNLSLSQTFQSQ